MASECYNNIVIDHRSLVFLHGLYELIV